MLRDRQNKDIKNKIIKEERLKKSLEGLCELESRPSVLRGDMESIQTDR